ncbi:hypothetical protein UFOVP312_31 [uncultured Caudovirales phage]|uniref:Uncharacterized protein n=1 Tax=uncultured Caudovirales phage TaxID=2100421 RepID=A0A6J5LQZ4_9CAUD|nr:hypothetical protein UFOVP312_31 [uncultured Caudovirales phage]
MMETQQQTDLGQQLQSAVLQAAMDTDDSYSGAAKDGAEMRAQPASPLNGARLPVGRPKGTANKTTRTIREAVERAARDCHPEGLAGWLVERAQGSLGDRQIFAQMVNKAMPLQVQAQVGGGVQIQLSWLGQRQIGTTVAQPEQQSTQVLDLQAESDGTYRIIDPIPGGGGGQAAPAAQGPTEQNSAGGPQGA